MTAPLRKELWQVTVDTTTEAEDACIEMLSTGLGVAASGYTDFEIKAVQVSAYLETKPADYELRIASIRARLREARAGGLNVGGGVVRCRRMKRENWAESWKRHFKPLAIGGSLLLKPSWSRRRPGRGQKVVVLDPGLSFGTGHHATTSFCLREVVRFHRRGGGSMLDMGCGSGVLAIAAARLGCRPVEAFDFDPEAVRVARRNARQNRVQDRIRLHQADVTRLSPKPARRFDLVCANLISTLLLAERKRIAASVKPGAILVLAGILQSEFMQVRKAFEDLGLKLVRQRGEREWCSGAFLRPKV